MEPTPAAVLEDLAELALRAPSRAVFFDEAAARLQRVLPHDGACWHTLDPGSDLVTEHHLQHLPDRFPVVAHNEYRVADVNKFADLARAPRKAASLYEATGGRMDASPRYRDLLQPVGVGPELRGAVVADGTAWGAVIITRAAGRPEFSRQEIDLLDRASALFARAIRRGLVTEATHAPQPGPDAPGMLELDSSGELQRASSTAEPLLAELSGTTAAEGWRSVAVQTLASATRQAVADRAAQLPSSQVKTPAGTWLVLHGARVGDDGVAVFIQRAHPTLVAPLLLKAHGLTVREREAAQWLLRGATSAQTAQRMGISTHTVNEHVKAIYDKTGARTRGELSAMMFFGEHLPRIQGGVPVGDDASFVDAPRPRGGIDALG
jgi:DNA-binding CsgD family transcriptional regulator